MDRELEELEKDLEYARKAEARDKEAGLPPLDFNYGKGTYDPFPRPFLCRLPSWLPGCGHKWGPLEPEEFLSTPINIIPGRTFRVRAVIHYHACKRVGCTARVDSI